MPQRCGGNALERVLGKSLKEKNQWLLLVVLTSNFIIFYGITRYDSIIDSKPVLSKSEKSKSENDLKEQNIKTNNKIPEIKSKPTQMLKDNSLKIQFGAFSKLKNAEIQKTKILSLLSTKFPNFERKFGILEENNLFKLIYTADNLSSSEVICDYSKSVKLNCLIVKR